MIREKFRSEAACARKMGWSRQRFHPIASGKRLPNVRELNQIAAVLERSVDELLPPLFAEAVSMRQAEGAVG